MDHIQGRQWICIVHCVYSFVFSAIIAAFHNLSNVQFLIDHLVIRRRVSYSIQWLNVALAYVATGAGILQAIWTDLWTSWATFCSLLRVIIALVISKPPILHVPDRCHQIVCFNTKFEPLNNCKQKIQPGYELKIEE